MNKACSILLALFFALPAFAQVSIERQVISPSGSSGNGSYYLDYTIGQPEYITGVSSNFKLTQGFQQPSAKDDIVVELEIEDPNCFNGNLGAIDLIEIGGCANENYELSLNGEVVEFPIVDLEEGDYLVTINAGFNCSFESTVEIRITDAFCELEIYNVISPDNDGFNDSWIIENIQLYNGGQNEVEIINRWGNSVYQAENYNNTDVVWNGDDKDGKALAVGTYFYRLIIGSQEFKGFVELLK